MKAGECRVYKTPDNRQTARVIGNLSKKAMLEEVYTTPKPGLVDCYSNGAHQDMNLPLFQKSAEAITPYLTRMALTGAQEIDIDEKLFQKIRGIGVEAEKAMFRATEGVNTHKGMIFSMGIFAAVAGYCVGHGYQMTDNTIFYLEQKLVGRTLKQEIENLRKQNDISSEESHGISVYKVTGLRGIRGEALSGYESVRHLSLPVYEDGKREKYDENRIRLQTLITLMSEVEDSNIVARKGIEALHMVQNWASGFLKQGGAYQINAVQRLEQMDAAFIAGNISAGGCADLLALTIFISDLKERFGV